MGEPRTWDLDDLAAPSDLATRYDVSQPTIANWPKRHANFPQPLLHLGGGPIYSITQVDAWMAGRQQAEADQAKRKIAKLEAQLAELKQKWG